ncbi:MAG TPA: PQQ-binding-like beta-propeller repeat protein, partial [Planctomycetota bacterium]|nr:PQQ-binding-like beta-propeller repeat protein [Planctomycetota bacterium]
VHALSLTTGRELWRFKGPGIVSGPPMPVSQADRAAVVYADGTVVWLDVTTGEAKQTRRLPGGVTGPVLMLGQTVCYGTADRTVAAFDLDAAKTLWQKGTRIPVEQSMTSTAGLVFVRFDEGKLLALSATDGELAWSFVAEGGRITAPATDDTRLYVATDTGLLCAFDARKGDPAWRVKLDGAVHVAPVVAGGRVYAGTESGTLWVLDATDGRVVWKTGLPGAPSAPVCVAGSRVLVSTQDGSLEAFER